MFIPQNEQGVIVLFAAMAKDFGWEFSRIETAFPDATLVRNGEAWQTEFEYLASNFLAHGHDHRECELIVCWENDYLDCPMPIIALNDDKWIQQELCKPDSSALAAEYWRVKAMRLERDLDEATDKIIALENESKYLQGLIDAEYNGTNGESAESILRRIPFRHRARVIEMMDVLRSSPDGIGSAGDFMRASGWKKSLAYLVWPIAESSGLIYLENNTYRVLGEA